MRSLLIIVSGGRKMGKTEGQTDRDALEQAQGTQRTPMQDPRSITVVYDENTGQHETLRTPVPVECV